MGNEARHNARSFESLKGRPLTEPPILLDRLGREVHEGDYVVANTSSLEPITFRVKAITPNLHPGAPANALSLLLVAGIPALAEARVPTTQLLLVGTPQPMETADAATSQTPNGDHHGEHEPGPGGGMPDELG